MPIVTFIILGLNLIGLIYEFSVGEDRAIYTYGMYEGALQDGEYLRLIVSAFLHFGIYHFASNMICLVIYGFSLENQVGPGKYALIYAIATLGSALLINFAGGQGIHAVVRLAFVLRVPVAGAGPAHAVYGLLQLLHPAPVHRRES